MVMGLQLGLLLVIIPAAGILAVIAPGGPRVSTREADPSLGRDEIQ